VERDDDRRAGDSARGRTGAAGRHLDLLHPVYLDAELLFTKAMLGRYPEAEDVLVRRKAQA
jgi:hypothetical protein